MLNREHDVYLLECSPFDPATGAAVTVRFGTHLWITEPADTPANVVYAPGLAFEGFGASSLDLEGGMLAGLVEMANGTVRIPVVRTSESESPGADALVRYAWNGYPFTIYRIARGAAYSAKTVHLTGFVTGAAAKEHQLALTITSKDATLAAKQIQERKFWGRKHALRFSASSSHSVSLGDNHNQTSSFTLEVLVRSSGDPSNSRALIEKWTSTGSGNGFWLYLFDGGRPWFAIENAGTQQEVFAPDGLDGVDFVMVSAVFDSTANTLTLFVDGVEVAQTTGVTIDPPTTTANCIIGADSAAGTTYTLNGDIAEVRIWNEARSAEEIAETLYAGFRDAPGTLVGWYKFGEGTGATLGDSSESALNGTITGATWIGTYEGEESLAGQPKPWAVGVCKERTPVQIDQAKLIYALCDRGLGDDSYGDFPAGLPVLKDGGQVIDLDSSSGSGSSPKTYYLKNATATSSSHGKMEEGSAPSKSTLGTGWTCGTTVASRYSLMQWATEKAAGTFGSTAMPNAAPTTNDCWRSESTITGRFQAGTWTVTAALRAVTSGNEYGVNEHKGRLRVRVWRSANANGSTATEITSATATSNADWVSKDWQTTVTASFSCAQVDLSSEYLFIQLAWEITVAGAAADRDVLLRIGDSKVVTAPFNSGGTSPVTDLHSATVASGKFKYDAALGLIRLGTAPALRLSATFCGAAFDGISTATPVGQMRCIVEEAAGFDAGDVDLTAEDFQPGGVLLDSGIYIAAGGTTCLEVLRRVAHNYRAVAGFQADGVFRAQPYWPTTFSGATPAFAYGTEQIAAGSFEIVTVLQPIREIAARYAPYDSAFSPAEIASGVTQTVRFDLQREYRRVFKSRGTDRFGNSWSTYKEDARKIVLESDLTLDWMLAYTVSPLLDVFSAPTPVVRFRLLRGSTPNKPALGELVTVTYPSFDYDAGVDCLVVGVSESQPGDAVMVDVIDATGLVS